MNATENPLKVRRTIVKSEIKDPEGRVLRTIEEKEVHLGPEIEKLRLTVTRDGTGKIIDIDFRGD